jgi:AraC family transcriptional regulator of adaptative response/methylated-DNA-[protein]-cysteine methyltransferase
MSPQFKAISTMAFRGNMYDRSYSQQSEDYRRIEKAIRFLEENFLSRPSLEQIAESVHLSPFHFDRLFKRWAGIPPVRFLQFLTLEYTKGVLAESRSLLDASLDAGLSGPGRLHDLFVAFEAMTPGEYKRRGEGLRIDYGFHATPFGECLIATTRRGICHLSFVDGGDGPAALARLRQDWPESQFLENAAGTGPVVHRAFRPENAPADKPFHMLLRGTNFQVSVWKALLAIPPGRLLSYEDMAACIGHPRAVRAAARAIAVNPVSYLIPCHRVIAKSGHFHRYGGGTARKMAMIGREAAATIDRNP